MARDEGEDIKGERGGDTGHTKQVEQGPQAEKGDARRDKPVHSGQTRGRTMHDQRSGSDSNAGSD